MAKEFNNLEEIEKEIEKLNNLKKELEEKKKAELKEKQEERKKEVDTALENYCKLRDQYIFDYGFYIYNKEKNFKMENEKEKRLDFIDYLFN